MSVLRVDIPKATTMALQDELILIHLTINTYSRDGRPRSATIALEQKREAIKAELAVRGEPETRMRGLK